jgi:sulfate-transporting ATPase
MQELDVTPMEPVQPATLSVKDVTVRFGGVIAVSDVSLTVRTGEVLGLIGPNGAGKTTLIDAVTGFVRPSQGTIELDGRHLERLGTHRRARAGVSRSFQSLELFDDVTVRDNLRAAADERGRGAYLADVFWPKNPPLSAALAATIREFDLERDLDRRPTQLPYGRRRLVAIARAVASQPKILLLDEPAAGLDDGETRELAKLVRRLADEWGFGVLLVEHDMSVVMSICDRVVALDFGRKIGEGTPEAIRSDSAVVAAYLGTPEDQTQPASQELGPPRDGDQHTEGSVPQEEMRRA